MSKKNNDKPWYDAPPRNNPYLKSDRPSRKGPPVWVFILGFLLLAGVAFFIFGYTRFNGFKEDTFGGRNEASLLPTATPTLAPMPTTAASSLTEVAAVAPTPVPTAAPSPTPDNTDPLVRRIKNGERVSVLVMGYGGGNHDGGFLTDTMMLMVFDPAKKAVSMINIPRDTWVYVPYGGQKNGFWGKANSAFAYIMNLNTPEGLSSRYRFNPESFNSKVDSAAILTRDVIENITGVSIDYWAAVSFDGFREFIDAIGGINVNVETTFDDYEYPSNDDPNIDASVMHIHFDAGRQYMNGEKAIQYSRSRHSIQDGTDFGRSKRQMNVVSAVKEQVAKPDILIKAFPIMNALQGKVRTSLSFDQTLALANYFRSSDGSKLTSDLMFVPSIISSANFLTDDVGPGGAYILVPREGQGKYKAIQDWIASGLLQPALRKENLKVQLQNATGLSAPMTNATDRLKSSGLNLQSPVWANLQNYSTIIDYSEGKADVTLKTLTNIFPNITVKTADPPYKGYEGPALVVVLGKDYLQDQDSRQYRAS